MARRAGFRAVAAALLALALPAAAAPASVVSLNLCTDQLLLALAAPETIRGLSPYARDRWRAMAPDPAGRYPVLSGSAEEVLVLKPDLILLGRFNKRATTEAMRRLGFRVEEFDVPRGIAEAKAQITRAGDLLGRPERAAALNARIEAGLAAARTALARSRLRVLPLQRRGWVSGPATLTGGLIEAIGLGNAAAELGFGRGLGGLVGLESIVMLRPDALLLNAGVEAAEDQGRAMLRHPALARLVPRERIITLPEGLSTCGGPLVAEALEHLAREVARLGL